MLPVVMEHFVRLGRELGKTDTELAAVLYLAYADCLSHANRIDGLIASNAPGLPGHVQHTAYQIRRMSVVINEFIRDNNLDATQPSAPGPPPANIPEP